MAITLHPPKNPARFRITRTWKGRSFQWYVAIKGNVEKARKQAEVLDEQLAQRQRAYLLRCELEGLHVMHPDGRIIGLQYQQRIRAGRKPTNAFKIRVVVDGRSPIFKTFEVNSRRTFDEAFELSVNFIAHERRVEKNSSTYLKMLNAKTAYLQMNHKSEKDDTKGEFEELFEIFAQEVQQFEQKQNYRVIRG